MPATGAAVSADGATVYASDSGGTVHAVPLSGQKPSTITVLLSCAAVAALATVRPWRRRRARSQTRG